VNPKLIFILLILLSLLIWQPAHGQKYTLETSRVEFFSAATIEDIKSENTKASSLLNVASGEIVFSIPIKEFEFEKSLMKEHFNEKYLESDKYPKAIFQGKFVNLNKDIKGEQSVTVSGKLTIHGVTQEVKIAGTMELKGGQLVAKAKFPIRLEDYKVQIPQLLWQNIAEEVEVTVEFIYKPI
jgi:polyisoprenoid-binding protein YceI